MGCQEENKFLRFSDTPSISNEGFVKVASSKEQLENMSLEDKERVVASVALLDTFTKDIQNTIDEISEDLTNNTEIDEKIKDVIKKIGDQSPQSLDIPQLFIIPNIGGAELRWNALNYKKDYVVKVYQKYNDEENFRIIQEIEKGKNYHLLSQTDIDLKRKPKWYVRAYNGNEAGNPSNEVFLDSLDWADVILGILHGKITETALARSLIDNLYNGFSEHLTEEINRNLERARTLVNQTEKQINSTIEGLRERLDRDIVGVKQQLLDHGTGISTLERKSNEHAERIDTISAVAQGAVSGLQQEKVARATEQEAYARETNTKISQVQGSLATVRDEVETKATELESLTNQVRDFRNIYGQNETRRTEQVRNLANADKAINEKIKSVESKTVNSQAKLDRLEETVAEKDKASTKRFNALRSSINGSHFPNYNFEGDITGWTTLQGEVSVIDTKDNSAPQKMALQALGNMPVTIHSNEPTRIEHGNTYALSGVLKCPDGINKVELVMMCFDKDKNFIRNIQTSPQYPLIDSKTNAGKGWVVVEGQISGNTTSWPTTDNTKIPMHAQFASPALIVTTKTGGKIWVTKLDMQDTSESEKNKALIKALETTQNTDRESIATTLREQETRLRNGISTATQQLQNKVTEIDGKLTAEASKIEDLKSEVGKNKSNVSTLTKAINDDRSSNAAKFETLTTQFKRDLSNVIINPTFTKTEVTSTLDSQGQVQITGERVVASSNGWNCEPKNKFSVITFQENQSQELKTKSPSNYYLKFWGNSLVPENYLTVNPKDKIYVGLHAHNLNNINAQIVVRYLDKNKEYLTQENLATFNGYIRVSTTLTVPENADKAELVIFTNSNTLAERQAVIISKPELRMNMAAIYADGKFEEAKTLVSNAQETVIGKVDNLIAKYNQSEATNKLERQAIARENEVITGKVEEQANRLGAAEGKIKTIESTQSTDKAAFSTFQRDITSKFEGSESKINELKKTTNDKYQSLAEKASTLESNFNTVDGRINSAIVTERANTEVTANRVAAEKSSEMKVKFDARLNADQNNLLSFTDTMNWGSNKQESETANNTVENGIAYLRGNIRNWKHFYQISKENGNKDNPMASESLKQVQYGLPYILTFEAKASSNGLILQPHLRLHYRNTGNEVLFRNSNLPSIPLTTDWKTYTVKLDSPSIQADETRENMLFLFETVEQGEIQIKAPKLYYDAKSAIERVDASIKETKQIAINAKGEVDAKIGLKIESGPDGAKRVVGWESTDNGKVGTFAISADNFYLNNPSVPGYRPFSVENGRIRFNGEVEFTKGTNLLKNPILSSTAKPVNTSDYGIPLDSVPGWKQIYVNASGVKDYFEVRAKNSDWSPDVELLPGELCINIRNDNRSPRAEERTGFLHQDISVTPESWYMFSAWVASHGSYCRLVTEEIDKNGNYLSSYANSRKSNAGGGRNLNNYDRLFVKFKARSPNVRLALMQTNVPNTQVTSVLQSFFFRPMLEQCSENATGPSAWSNSNIGTVIDGDQIKTGLVRVGNGVNLLKNPGLWRDTQYKNKDDYFGWEHRAPYGWQEGYIGDAPWKCLSWHNNSSSPYRGGIGLPDRCDVIQLVTHRTTAQMGWTIGMSQYLWLSPGKTYIYSVQGALYGSRSGCRVERYNSITGAFISNYGEIPLEQARSVNGVNAMNWDRKWFKFTIPPDHEGYVRVFIGLISAGDRDYSDGYFFRPMLEEVPEHQNEPSAWSDSATLITPNSIATNSLSALSANMGSITAGSISINGRAGITSDGHLWANGVNINGNVVATSGSFTGDVYANNGRFNGEVNATSGTFNGTVYATNGSFSGNITATGGSIRGVLQVGDDWNNGVRIHGDDSKCIVVVEGGHIKVRLGKL